MRNVNPNTKYTSPIRRRDDHMSTNQGEPVGICPKTGERIEIQPVPIKIIVRRFLMNFKKLPHPLDKYKAMGVKNMTDRQIESAYKIIKNMSKGRVL